MRYHGQYRFGENMDRDQVISSKTFDAYMKGQRVMRQRVADALEEALVSSELKNYVLKKVWECSVSAEPLPLSGQKGD
jgi:hypothetical protein